jgi:hypothetical protein
MPKISRGLKSFIVGSAMVASILVVGFAWDENSTNATEFIILLAIILLLGVLALSLDWPEKKNKSKDNQDGT